jgi:hypothetical protein
MLYRLFTMGPVRYESVLSIMEKAFREWMLSRQHSSARDAQEAASATTQS